MARMNLKSERMGDMWQVAPVSIINGSNEVREETVGSDEAESTVEGKGEVL